MFPKHSSGNTVGTLVLETKKEAGAGVLGWGQLGALRELGQFSAACRTGHRCRVSQQNLTPAVGTKVNSFPGPVAVRSVGVGESLGRRVER